MTEEEKTELPDQVDIYDAKQTLEDFVNEIHASQPEGYKVRIPTIKEKDGYITINHQIESDTFNKGASLDIFDLFSGWYPGKNAFEQKGINKFMDMYSFTYKGLATDGETRKLTRLRAGYSEGAAVITKDGHGRIGPNVKIEFTTQHLDKRDVEFNKEFYKALIEEPIDQSEDQLARLQELGVIYEPDLEAHTWDRLKGYFKTKKELENKLIRPNLNSDFFDALRRHTRTCPDQVTYNCFLFKGTYGTGKTAMAKVIANQLGYHYLEVPLDSIFTKWYGESERILGNIFKAARKLENCVLFLDEIDCVAGNRENGMHEATQRVMSVLMTNTAKTNIGEGLVVIGATNKPDTLDGALLRRFKKEIMFPLPTEEDRALIFDHYAKHIGMPICKELAKSTENFSPYDILAVCDTAEELFADDYLAGKLGKNANIGLSYYRQALKETTPVAENNTKKRTIGFGRGLEEAKPAK